MTAPRATYRLQLNKDFTFADALALVPYLEALGISHAYLSPILMARPGSTHGYDTADHARINPELGTLEDFRRLSDALRQRRMGILLDFVPNHMGVGGADNALWLDVLKHGKASRYADWFDIDWSPPRQGMDGKLLVPFLGKSYGETLAEGQIRLKADPDGTDFAVWAYDGDKLPIRPEDTQRLLDDYGDAQAAVAAHEGEPGNAPSWAQLNRLIANQHWRLAHFAVAADEINYRRFFVNSDLAGIRIEKQEVFDHAHQLIFQLIADGLVDGLRIDHVDGLRDPKGYLVELQRKAPRPIYLVIEKILAPHERLRADWPVDGTTGYEIGAELTRLLIPAGAEPLLTRTYEAFTGNKTAPEEEAYRCKLRVMDNELAGELAALSRRFSALAWRSAETRDLTELALRRGLREIIAQLAVYRTYADGDGIVARDRRELGRAIAESRKRQLQIQPAVFDFIEAVLCEGLAGEANEAAGELRARFQQLTGPVMAKGLEDTALYRYNRLVALNEVGAHPDRFRRSIAAFHDSNRRRLETHPDCMIATSTHDTKRGEDIRAIISALADAPQDWDAAIGRWTDLVGGAPTIDRNDLYLIFQLLIGGWPVAGDAPDLAHRLTAAMVKSLREARLRSDWGVNNSGYEEAVGQFITDALANKPFLADFRAVQQSFAAIGRRKALIQAALKLTIPGVPDIYRGAEDWEQSFVDPDNRRPVDFSALAKRLAKPQPGVDDKLILTQTLLSLRTKAPDLFARGSYEPIALGQKTIAFRRRLGPHEIVLVADLSPGHGESLPRPSTLPTVYGSDAGPVWILAGGFGDMPG